ALRGRKVKPYPAGRIGRYCQRADADRSQSGLFAKTFLGVCPGRATDIAARAERNSKRLGGERRIRLSTELQNQRDPANDVVPIDILVEEAISGGCRFELRKVRNCSRKSVDMAERV